MISFCFIYPSDCAKARKGGINLTYKTVVLIKLRDNFILFFVLCSIVGLVGCQKSPLPISSEVLDSPIPSISVPVATEISVESLSTSTRTMTSRTIQAPTLLVTETYLPRLTATPDLLSTSTSPIFDVITAANFRNLTQLSEIQVGYDLEFSDWFQLVFKSETVWLARSFRMNGIQITDLKTGQIVTKLQPSEEGGYGELIISSNSQYLAAVSSGNDQIDVWDMMSFQIAMTFPFRSILPLVAQGAFSKDNQYFAVAGCRVNERNFCLSSAVTVYDLKTGKILQEIVGYQEEITGLAFSTDNKLLFMSGVGEKIRNADLLVWNLDTNRRQLEMSLEKDDWFNNLALDDERNTLIAVAYTETVYVWNTKTWEKAREYPVENIISIPVFLPNTGEFLFIDSQGNLALVASNEGIISTINIGHANADRMLISPDGKFVYFFGRYGFLQKWGAIAEDLGE